MLRILIGTGALLMAVGFGAAGWQYWQSLPKAEPVAAVEDQAGEDQAVEDQAGATAEPRTIARQSWLISPSGGLIPQDDVRAYLAQDRFAPRRTVVMTLQANLADLLAEGEKLPEVSFLQVLADIRAPRVAEGLCAVMQRSFAADCAVNAARVVEDSVDPAAGTALFRIELVYRFAEGAEEVPDLAAHVLRQDGTRLTLDPGTPGTESAEAALGAALAAATEACAAEGVGKLCRPMQLAVDWRPGAPVEAAAEIAWLSPLPDGMFVAPSLSPVTGN
jgi:hypothetical protein